MDSLPAASRGWRTSTRRRWALLLFLAASLLLAFGARHRFTRPDARLERGERAVLEGDWDRADDYAERLEAAGATDHAHFLRGLSLQARHRPDQALMHLNRIRDTGRLHQRAATLSGRCLIELKNLPEAARVLNHSIERNADDVEAHRGLAAIAYDLGQLGLAIHHLERVASLDHADARPHRLIGLIYKDVGEDEPAVAAYRIALERTLTARTRTEVRVELAEVLVRLSRHSEALNVLDAEALEGSTGIAVRAEALRGLARGAEAARLLDLEPTAKSNAEMLRVRGQLHLDAGEFDAAVVALERAASRLPADYRVQFLLSQAFGGAGRIDDAKRAGDRAETLRKDLEAMTKLSREAIDKPWDAAVRDQLAETAERMGKPQLAEMWRKAAQACRARR